MSNKSNWSSSTQIFNEKAAITILNDEKKGKFMGFHWTGS